jgi:hypothetical protein
MPIASTPSRDSEAWAMPGYAADRGSASPLPSAEIAGQLHPVWQHTLPDYVSQKVQLVASHGLVLIAGSAGLTALAADDGALVWQYPTALPLGNAPTVLGDLLYVAGYDRCLHALELPSGRLRWRQTCGRAGFSTSPLPLANRLYLGDRAGYFYAVDAQSGAVSWSFNAQAPILFSAAGSAGSVYFATLRGQAFALAADSGVVRWQTQLPTGNFRSWWPVLWQNQVIFCAPPHYRAVLQPGGVAKVDGWKLFHEELLTVFDSDVLAYQSADLKRGQYIARAVGKIRTTADGRTSLDAQRILQYLQQQPARRSVFVLDQQTGQQNPAALAPVLWAGTHSGNRYPPALGNDGWLYQHNVYFSPDFDLWRDAHGNVQLPPLQLDPLLQIPGGQVCGWQPGNPNLHIASAEWNAVDEPIGCAVGGQLVYWNLCADREAGAFRYTQPDPELFSQLTDAARSRRTFALNPAREWKYFDLGGNRLGQHVPGYDQCCQNSPYHRAFGIPNGSYGNHGDTNPPIPYRGRLYMLRGNTVLALQPAAVTQPAARVCAMPPAARSAPPPLNVPELRQQLSQQVQAFLQAGELRPGYGNHGLWNFFAVQTLGSDFADYFHCPAETVIILLRTLPHLPPDVQAAVRAWALQQLQTYPLLWIEHSGWSGKSREYSPLPPDIDWQAARSKYNYAFAQLGGWVVNPLLFYALAQVVQACQAQQPDLARLLWQQLQAQAIPAPIPSKPEFWQALPYVQNAYLAGLLGYGRLQYWATGQVDAAADQAYRQLLQYRRQHFAADSAFCQEDTLAGGYANTLNTCAPFLFLVPEIATILQRDLGNTVRAVLSARCQNAPYWFVNFAEEGLLENILVPLYDSHALFMVQAWWRLLPAAQLAQYLDTPAFAVGDLYTIDKLAALLSMGS